MRGSRRVLPLLVLAASLQALWPVARGGAQTTEADVHVAQAIIAIDERRYDAALAELKRALEIEPDHVEALYYTGVVYAAQRRPDLAVPFLEKARAKAPADPAVGFQLGLAYFARQQYDRAQPLPEAVFKTNPELDGLGDYLGFLRYRAQAHRAARAASTGELFAVRADYVWWRTEDWESSLGYSFFTTYNNNVPRFSVLDHLVSAGLVRKLSLGSRPAQLGLQYSYEWLGLDADEFLTRHTLALSGAVVESEHHLTQAFARFQNKDFDEGVPPPPRQEVRDAHNYMAGFLHLLRFAQDRHFVKVGYQIDWDQTDGRNYEYVGHRLSAGAQYTLPVGGVRLKYDFDVHLRDYRHRSSILPTYAPDTRRRADQEYTYVARAELPLPGNFTLAAEVLVTNARSNIEVFDFDRHVFSLVLSWAY